MAWTTPRTWVAGEVLTAALLNTHLRDNLNAINGIWQAYTPTYTGGFNAGSGATLVGRWTQIGKTVHFRARITLGTGFTIGSAAGLSLPVNYNNTTANSNVFSVLGSTGVNTWLGGASTSSTACSAYIIGTNGQAGAITSTQPFVWKATDTLDVTGTYEAA